MAKYEEDLANYNGEIEVREVPGIYHSIFQLQIFIVFSGAELNSFSRRVLNSQSIIIQIYK